MNINRKIAYNKDSAEKHDWSPSDFGASGFDADLIERITVFQREHDLVADGLCGSATLRYLHTIEMEDFEMPVVNASGEYIICKGERIPIKWNKVVTWNEEGGLKASNFKSHRGTRNPSCFITHWDATLSSHHCARILQKRKLSVHFMIDNDGTIYQMADTNDICWHARGANNRSIGVEITNAYYLKWEDWYIRKGFGRRPLVTGAVCHGRELKPFMGFYHVQLQALTALYEAINKGHGIPLVAPQIKTTVDPSVVDGSFKGFCSHYHLTDNKLDCAGLDIDTICEKAITLKNQS